VAGYNFSLLTRNPSSKTRAFPGCSRDQWSWRA